MLSVNFTASTELNLFSDSFIRNNVQLSLQHQLNKPFLVTVLGIIRNNVQLSLEHQLN